MVRETVAAICLAMILAIPATARAQGIGDTHDEMVSDQHQRAINIEKPTSSTQTEVETLDVRDRAAYARDYRAGQAVASCLVKRKGGKAADLVGGDMSRDPQYWALRKQLADDSRCIAKGDGVPVAVVNAALAEQIALDMNDLSPLFDAARDEAQVERFTHLDRALEMTLPMLGRCQAVHAPDLARTLLQRAPGSDAEEDALNALFSATARACGVDSLPASVPVLYQRSMVATGLFDWIRTVHGS